MDDPRFEKTNPAQWLWYLENIRQDNIERVEELEYLASFWNSEGVRRARDARKFREEHGKTDLDFEESLKDLDLDEIKVIQKDKEEKKENA